MKLAFLLAPLAAIAVAQTQTVEPKIGQPAPAFSAIDSMGKTRSLTEFKGKHVVLEWTNHDCPIVKKHYGGGAMQATQAWAKEKGVVWLCIVSSAEGKQGYVTADQANVVMKEKGHKAAAMLLDPSGKIGKAYQAKTTPHMFVIDPKGNVIFMGGIDDKPGTNPADIPGARNHVRKALEESLAGKPVSVTYAVPYGCSVKFAD